MYKLLIILCCLNTSLLAQNDSIKINVLNDTIFFGYISFEDSGESDTVLYISDSSSIDSKLNIEITNHSKKDYILYLDTNSVWVHEFRPFDISDSLRYDHGSNLMTLLYDAQMKRKDSGGGFVKFDYESIKHIPRITSTDIINDYKKRKVKIHEDRILDNYSFNQNRFYLKAGEKKTFKIKMKIPYFVNEYLSEFTLNKDEIYYVDFYFHNKCHKTKEALTKAELKELKKKDIHIYGGTIHTNKKIVLMYKENGK